MWNAIIANADIFKRNLTISLINVPIILFLISF